MKASLNKSLKLYALLSALFLLSACSMQPEQSQNEHTVSSADGNAIYYAVTGHGEPTIVFIHCWTCDHTFWDEQIKHFSRSNRVVWLDLTGHGQSGKQRKQYTMAAFGQDVAAVVNKIGAREVILVGHSMGGPVAVEAAKLLGNKVKAIVGVDTFYTPFKYPKEQAAINQFVKPFKSDFKGTTKQLVSSMFSADIDPILKADLVDKFAAADPKVGISAMYELFIWNARQAETDLDRFADILYNINAAPTGKEVSPNAHTIMIPHVGHFIAQVKPQAFNRALETIIKKVNP